MTLDTTKVGDKLCVWSCLAAFRYWDKLSAEDLEAISAIFQKLENH